MGESVAVGGGGGGGDWDRPSEENDWAPPGAGAEAGTAGDIPARATVWAIPPYIPLLIDEWDWPR